MAALQLINLIAAILSVIFSAYWTYQKAKIPKYELSSDLEYKSIDKQVKELTEVKADLIFRLERATHCDTRIMIGLGGFLITQLIHFFIYA